MNKIFEIPLYPYERSPDQDALNAVRHPVVVIGAGPIGLGARHRPRPAGRAGRGARRQRQGQLRARAPICFAKRPLEILDRLGCGERDGRQGRRVEHRQGVLRRARRSTTSTCCRKRATSVPAFINLQQYYFEEYLVDRVRELQAEGKPIELRGGNKVAAIGHARRPCRGSTIETPDGPYELEADWLIACDGANSPTRRHAGPRFRRPGLRGQLPDRRRRSWRPISRPSAGSGSTRRSTAASRRCCTSSPTMSGGSTSSSAGTSTARRS